MIASAVIVVQWSNMARCDEESLREVLKSRRRLSRAITSESSRPKVAQADSGMESRDVGRQAVGLSAHIHSALPTVKKHDQPQYSVCAFVIALSAAFVASPRRLVIGTSVSTRKAPSEAKATCAASYAGSAFMRSTQRRTFG